MSFLDGFTPIQHVEQISYAFDPAKGVIREQWTGLVTAAVLREHWPKFLDYPGVLDCRKTVTDISNATVDVSGNDFFNLTHGILNPRLNGRKWITAIVVSTEFQFGVSRQYGAYASAFSEDQVFKNAEQAFLWIAGKHHEDPVSA